MGFEEATASLCPNATGMGAVGDCFFVAMNDQADTEFGGIGVAELDHFFELVTGVDVEEGEGNGSGVEGFLGQAEHHGRVFADGIEHHRALKLAGDFAEDVDAFRLKSFEIGKAGARGVHMN